jgi:hypothetical protein
LLTKASILDEFEAEQNARCLMDPCIYGVEASYFYINENAWEANCGSELEHLEGERLEARKRGNKKMMKTTWDI